LPVPGNYDPDTHMLARTVDGRTYHAPIPAAVYAAELVANGTAEDLQRAGDVLSAVLDCQECRADDPHVGNFLWEREDEVVEDLNAVQFVLFNLIPILISHADRLTPAVRNRALEAIRLGLWEIQRIDVHFAYTNIVLKDITNSCLGGELLGDAAMAERGFRKLCGWLEYTDRGGIPQEYNSPTYAAVAIRVLGRLAEHVVHCDTRVRARLALARLGLSAALHIHTPTRRWAGPFSRAYRPTVFCESPPERDALEDWIGSGVLPGWTADVLEERPAAFQVTETADAEKGVGITTFHSPSFALGVASRELTTQANRFIALQSNTFIAHFRRPGQERPGVLFSRYLLDDRWVGDYRTTPSRSADQLLPEEGRFIGVQSGPRAIGLYAPPEHLNAWSRIRSAKVSLVCTQSTLVDEIWVGSRRIHSLPAEVPDGDVVTIGSGDLLAAVRPFGRTALGSDAPIRLAETHGHLALQIYTYRGPRKSFWELAHPGSFYQGVPKCGFFAELSERGNHADGRAFCEMVASGQVEDVAAPPRTFGGDTERLWHVAYARDGASLGLEVDLMKWQTRRRWTQHGDPGWPMLHSPVACQSRTGEASVGGAEVTCSAGPVWLLAIPARRKWVAGYSGRRPATLVLSLPDGDVKVQGMSTGTVVWDRGEVTVDAVHVSGAPQVSGGRLVHISAARDTI